MDAGRIEFLKNDYISGIKEPCSPAKAGSPLRSHKLQENVRP